MQLVLQQEVSIVMPENKVALVTEGTLGIGQATTRQILFAGGSGVVGRAAVRWFRERYPGFPVLIGGRNLQAAAEVVAIDLDKPRLGLGGDVAVAAVVMLAPEAGLKGLSYAQDLGVPYLNINAALTEIGPELAMFAHRATAAPVVLASHWMAGAAVFLALNSAKGFESIQSIRIGAILDEQDPAGPASLEDMERVHGSAPPAMLFEGWRRVWLSGDAAKGKVESVDGRSLDATAFSTFDIEGGANGQTKRSRSMLEFKHGACSLTGLSVVLSLASVLGLNDRSPARPWLYLPELLSDARWFLDELRSAGATIWSKTLSSLFDQMVSARLIDAKAVLRCDNYAYRRTLA